MDRKLAKCSVNVLVVAAVIALWAFAWRSDHAWFERHVQRHYLYLATGEERAFRILRLIAALAGLGIVTARARVARWAEMRGGIAIAMTASRSGLAAVLALVTVELVLRRALPPIPPPGKILPLLVSDFPLVRYDDRLGWTHPSSFERVVRVGDRDVHYAFDASGYRTRSPRAKLDPSRPSIAFVGESIFDGHGLDYSETIPARIEDMTGFQTINLAVPGYGNDQSYLRFADALPTLPPLLAVVTLFLGPQLDRNAWTFRTRLTLDAAGSLKWLPADSDVLERLQLTTLWRNLVPYRDDRPIALTREVFRQTAAVARARGAKPLFVLFSWGPERPLNEHKEAWLYRELFESEGLPAIIFDAQEAIAGDGHPTAPEAKRMADAIARALRNEGGLPVR